MSTPFYVSVSEAPSLREILTPREVEVGRLLSQGYTNKDIGITLGICEGSVKQRVSSIYQKSGCLTRVDLAHRFERENNGMPTTLTSATSLAGLCVNCRVLLETPKPPKFEFDTQVWTCKECGQARKWGNSRPWDRWAQPALICEGCDAVTRHVFLRVEGC